MTTNYKTAKQPYEPYNPEDYNIQEDSEEEVSLLPLNEKDNNYEGGDESS